LSHQCPAKFCVCYLTHLCIFHLFQIGKHMCSFLLTYIYHIINVITFSYVYNVLWSYPPFLALFFTFTPHWSPSSFQIVPFTFMSS
jgi:hypothetical protein